MGIIDRDTRRDSFLDDIDDLKARLDLIERFGITHSDIVGPGINVVNPEYNVVSFGALGANDSGDATTNQEAFQRTLSTAPDDSVIVIPEGRFYIDATITVAGKDHVTIRGPGVVKPTGAFPAFTVDDTSARSTEHIYFDRVRIIGNGSTSLGIRVANTNANGVRYVMVDQCEISQCLKAIHTTDDSGTNQAIVTNCRLTADDLAGSIGIHIQSADCKIINNFAIRGWETGIKVDTDASAIMIAGNHIFMLPSTSANYDCCIAVRRGATTAAVGFDIIGNYLDGDPNDGAIVLDSQGARGVNISDNFFHVEYDGGPFIAWEHTGGGTYDIQDTTITGNIFYGTNGTKTNSFTFANTQTDGSENFHVHSNTWNNNATPYSTRDVEQTITYGASITPNAMLGRVAYVTLTGNTTINTPSAVDKGGIANKITFIIIQDGTGGHTVGWGGEYNTGWNDNGNTANKIKSVSFVWNGTNWYQYATSGYY